jgi:hypothetical protein
MPVGPRRGTAAVLVDFLVLLLTLRASLTDYRPSGFAVLALALHAGERA